MTEVCVKHPPGAIQFPRPLVTPENARALLVRLYALEPTTLKEYPSYDDRAFYVKTAPTEGIKGQTEFILKVSNAEITSHGPGAIATQTDILRHLVERFPELRCQTPVPTVDGRLLSHEMIQNHWKDGEGVRRQDALSTVRLYVYLPGQTLYDVSPLAPAFFYKAGKHLGDLQLALQTYLADVEPLKKKGAIHSWCLDNTSWLKQDLEVIRDAGKRALVEEVIGEFEKTVVPALGELRKGIVNHDFIDTNVLVMPSEVENIASDLKTADSDQSSDYVISGLIDFDEMVYSCLVHEIAVAMMYMMLCSSEPLEVTGHLLAGFESRAPLPKKERRLLRVLTAARFAQSLVYGLVTAERDPDNAYVTTTQMEGWTYLEMLWKISEQDLINLWDKIRRQWDNEKCIQNDKLLESS